MPGSIRMFALRRHAELVCRARLKLVRGPLGPRQRQRVEACVEAVIKEERGLAGTRDATHAAIARCRKEARRFSLPCAVGIGFARIDEAVSRDDARDACDRLFKIAPMSGACAAGARFYEEERARRPATMEARLEKKVGRR